jgi:ion channel-forming bestrophin family protein
MAEPRKYVGLLSWKYILPAGNLFSKILFCILAYTLFVIWWDEQLFAAKKFTEITSVLYSSAGMGLLLAFRTNSAYERWWEARKLWGQLVNDIRNLSIKVKQFVPVHDPRRNQIALFLIQYPQVLRDHLRGHLKVKSVEEDGAEITSFGHVPMQVADTIYRRIGDWHKEGVVDGFAMLQMDVHARALMDICGACERILKSPIAGSYKFMIWAGISIYLVILPWLVVPNFGFWAIPLVMISAYFVLGIEILAEEVERPFGLGANDLPLDAICLTIRDSVQSLLTVQDSNEVKVTGAFRVELMPTIIPEKQETT